MLRPTYLGRGKARGGPRWRRGIVAAWLLPLCLAAADLAPDPSLTNRVQAIPANGRVLVPLLRASPPAAAATNETLDLQLTPFRDALTGDTLPVQMTLPGVVEALPALTLSNVPVAPTTARLDLVLLASEPTSTNAFEGALLLRQNGGAWTRHPLSLRRRLVPKPAVLVLDQNTVEAALVRRFWTKHDTPLGKFTVRVREKSGTWPLEGLSVRLEQVAKAPATGFDLQRCLAFRVNDVPVKDLASWPPETPAAKEGERTIPAGGQAVIEGEWRDLRPGEYQVTLRFQATNSADDEAQKLTLHFQVRHGWVRPVLTLTFALGLSWFLTKFLAFTQKRLTLRQRLEGLTVACHPAYQNHPAAVWSRALVAQARRLTERLWLSGYDAIDAKLKQAAAFMELLAKASELRKQLDAAGLPTFIAFRVRAKIDNVLGGLSTRQLDDALRQQTAQELEALKVWLQDSLFVEQYRADLGRDVKRLGNRVQPELVTDAPARARIEALRQDCELQAGDDLKKLLQREEAYARLKVIWERRQSPEFATLWPHTGNIEEFFKLADDAAWQRLKQADASHRLTLKAPAEPQAYEDLRFQVVTGDADLESTFLFQHGLTWEWNWNFRGAVPAADAGTAPAVAAINRMRRAMAGGPAAADRRETTQGPWLVQFAAGAGTLAARLTVRRGSEAVEIRGPAVTVSDSREFSILQGFEEIEVWSTVIALLLALVSGLSAKFFNAPAFGTAGDYLTLFLWGVGVDQAKNAWQVFSTYSTRQ